MRTLLVTLALLIPFTVYSQDIISPKPTDNKKYGLKEKYPIKVGGGMMPKNVYSYLNNLAGPKGEKVYFERIGSGPSYDNPDSTLTPYEQGVLTMFYVWYGNKKKNIVYFDQYRFEKPQVLNGFTWKE